MIKYPYLFILIKLSPWDWKNQFEMRNMNVDEENGKAAGMANGRSWKSLQFSSNAFWNNISCLVSAPTFGLGGSRLCEKEDAQNIIGRKKKTS